MADTARINQLVQFWQKRRQEGQTLSPEEVCVGCPELLEDFRRHIQAATTEARPAGKELGQSATLQQADGDRAPSPAPRPVGTIAGYEILGELGRGGMGVVYKARQLKLNRLVALKMVLAGGHAGPEELARFRAEAEAVARVRHPNIVQIYEVGEQDGFPFFSLEYVDGGSLADQLNGVPQPPRPAAQLVATLARAMHAAHQQGILHRDLKPANILLQIADCELRIERESGIRNPPSAIPKISDFGLAKFLDRKESLTVTGAIVGTVAYMAPEQAWGRSKIQRLGPTADIYSLGVILYELLTGRPPFRGETLQDTLEQVISLEPVPPSRLQPKVPRDLQTICLKCLQKDPAKRYRSAQDLADDLDRFLAGATIRARPVRFWERGIKYARRRPAVTALLAAVVVVTLAGLGGILWQWQEAVTARQKAEDNAAQASRASREARDQRGLAVATLKSVVLDIQRQLENRPGMLKLQQQLLQPALQGLEKVARSAETAAEADHTLAVALTDMGEIFLIVGRTSDAQHQFRRAHQILERLVDAAPRDVAAHADLAVVLDKIGDAYMKMGKMTEAKKAYFQALDLRRELNGPLASAPGQERWLLVSLSQISLVELRLGNTAAARAYILEALKTAKRLADGASGDAQPQEDLVTIYDRLGDVNLQRGKAFEARQAFQEGLLIAQRLAKADPGNLVAQRTLALLDGKLGNANEQLGELDAAREAYQQARDIAQRCADADPSNAQAQRDLCIACTHLGQVEQALGKHAAAEKIFRDGLKIARRLVNLDPANVDFQRELSIACNDFGDATGLLGDFGRARAAYRQGLQINRRLAVGHPNLPPVLRGLWVSYMNLGGLDYQVGNSSAARESYRSGLEVAERLAAIDADNAQARRDLGASHYLLGRVEQQALQFSEAERCFTQSLAILRPLVQQGKLAAATLQGQLLPTLEKSIAVCQAAPWAVKDLSFALKQPAALVPELLVLRARELSRQGRHEEAAATTEKLVERAGKDAELLYQAAACYARCAAAIAGAKPEQRSAADQAAGDRYAARALVLLARAHTAGYFKVPLNVATLERARDFAALVSRSDFQKLLRELEKEEGLATTP